MKRTRCIRRRTWQCRLLLTTCLLLALFGAPLRARASATVFVGEPFGNFGTMMPLGHAAIFLDHVCADGPLKLRHCHAGEPEGVVLARYANIRPYDWMATPVMQFLYATSNLRDVPEYATPEVVWGMRQRYRERYLRTVVPDGTEGHFHSDGRAAGADLGEWWESAGMAYNRRVWAYQVNTTPEQDGRVIDTLNADANRHLYHLKKTNCADFAANLINLIYPGSVHNDRIADFGWMTPKEVVRSLTDYAAQHPTLNLRVWQIPQVPGSLRRSRPVRGGAESGLKTKRYLFTLLAIQPEVPLGLSVLYLWHGRWAIGRQTPEQAASSAPADSPAERHTGRQSAKVAEPMPGLTRPHTDDLLQAQAKTTGNQLQAKSSTGQPSGD